MRNISNSEVTTWLSCRRMYDYAFMQNLTPKDEGRALTRGTLGHEVFNQYIDARLNDANHEQALQTSSEVYTQAINEGLDADIVLEVKGLIDRYMEYHKGWPEWTLLGTEEALEVKLTDDITIVIRYDLMVMDNETGKILVGDFKFAYDFWRYEEHALNAQLPKYISVMQTNGFNVQGGFLEEIRTRKLGSAKAALPENTWKRTHYFPSVEKRRNFLRQHIAASLEIDEFRKMSDEERQAKTIPVYSKHGACKFCNFKSLCIAETDGKQDLTYDIEMFYKQNTYGYNKENDNDEY